MRFGNRFLLAVNRIGQALGGRRPGVELVRLPELPPPRPEPLALPTPPRPRLRRRSGGFGAYGQAIASDPGGVSARPLGQGPAHDCAVYRDSVSPWRAGGLAPPPPSGDLDELRAELYAPRIPWWEQREQRER
jgi:hypothetical protein